MSHSVYFGGSRVLPPSATLRAVARAVVHSGCVVHVGCSVGADAQVVEALSGQSSLVVFAIFGAGGAGACPLSAVHGVASHAVKGGAVHWWAGGPASIPLPGRLIRRSLAALDGCGQAVFFEPGPGSLAVASHAIKSGVPVFAFSAFAPASPRGCAGAWQPIAPESYYAAFGWPCWVWQPEAVQPGLF
jgi:hypothetical protein